MAYTTLAEGMSYPEYTGIPYTYWTGLQEDPEGTGGYGIVIERRNPTYTEEPSLAYTTWDKIQSLLNAASPVTTLEDVINYNNTTDAKNPVDYTLGLIKDRWSKQLGRVSNGLKLANWWSPSMHVGATRRAMQNGFGFRSYGNDVLNGNPGLFDEEGFWPMLGNATFDLAITSPRAITSLADVGASYLSNLGRRMPPPAGAVAVVDNGVIPIATEVSGFRFPTEGWNGISTVPAINEAGDQVMALGATRQNPNFNPQSRPRPTQSEFYPGIQEITPEEQELLRAWAEKNGIDLSDVNLNEFYKSIMQDQGAMGKFINTPNGQTIGYIGSNDPTLSDISYRFGRILQNRGNAGRVDLGSPAGKTFRDLGVTGKGDVNGPSISSGRAAAADIRAQLWDDGYLTIDHLNNPETFEFTSGDLVDYLNSAHGGQYVTNPNISIYGFKRVPILDKKLGITKYTLDWDPTLTPEQVDNITKTWKDAIFYFKSGNKLIPRRVHK